MSKPLIRVVIVTLLFVALADTQASADASPTSQPSYTRREDVVYGRFMGTALTMDVFKPTGTRNGAVVMFMVSGGFISNHDSIAPPLINGFLRPFLDRGYVVCAVVHGSAPKFTIAEIVPQIKRAVQYVRANAHDAGLDPNRIGVTGGSAGGHLSLIAGTWPAAANPASADQVERVSGKIAAVACFYPPTDFTNWGKPGQLSIKMPNTQPFAAAFDFHEFDETTHRLMPVSEQREVELLRELSPITHATTNAPPTLIIHGDADPQVPIQQSILFIDKLKSLGVEAELDVKKDAGHGWPAMAPDIEKCADWFDAHLLGERKGTTVPATAPSRAG